ncbi:MAG: type VI secretion system tip protein VgrG [Bacteroidales bacterium]|nr:type VI secretion system tip protein VgrG [Bacteroidales bacterium]
MITQTTAAIQIGEDIYKDLASIEISQQIHGHHFFRVALGSEKIGEPSNAFLEKAREYAGFDISIEIDNVLEDKLAFKGVIVNVRAVGMSTSQLGHKIVIEGYSPTILLDSGMHSNSYTDKSLADIAREVCNLAPQNLLKPSIGPRNTDPLPFTVQYNESWFGFLNRLACRYGEWFYYDGFSLVFGQKEQAVTDMYYGIDLQSFELSMNLGPTGQVYTARSYKECEVETAKLSDYNSAMRGHTAFALKKSSETFMGSPTMLLHQFNDDEGFKNQLGKMAGLEYSKEAGRRVVFSGTGNNPALKPGGIIAVNYRYPGGTSKLGEYIITSVQHSWKSGGEYHNTFTAVPSDIEVSPMTNPGLVPHCPVQSAIVNDNNDPDGLGRVQVKFGWQKNSYTPWLRIATPYAGADKGMYFVPETGEEVMVAFEGGNAEKPFVMGAMYNGKAKPESWKTETNDKKAIRTRSGHTIELDDTSGEEKISIYDNEGSIITFDTKAKSLQIVSSETIDISAKNINISAKEKINLDAQGDKLSILSAKAVLIESSGDNINMKSAKKIVGEAQQVLFKGQQKLHMESDVQASIKSPKTSMQGTTSKAEVI